jgi:hypothetical protein
LAVNSSGYDPGCEPFCESIFAYEDKGRTTALTQCGLFCSRFGEKAVIESLVACSAMLRESRDYREGS